MKSLALFRTGRKAEADHQIDELLDSNTSDENALNIIMQYCKETQQVSKIVYFYEKAAAKYQNEPALVGTVDHEDIMSSLFYAYVRVRDFGKQQQVALKLYKQTNKMMFCYWNAASYVMMSNTDLDGDILTPQQRAQRGMYSQLAVKILQKAYQEQKMEYNGEFLLYLHLLETSGKYEEALAIVNAFDEARDLSKIGQIDFKAKKKINYFGQLKKWAALQHICELFIADESNANLDDWPTYLKHVDSLVEQFGQQEDEALQQQLVEEALAFYATLIGRIESTKETKETETIKVVPKAQSPYLARIQLINRITQLKPELITKFIETLKEFLMQYIRNYSAKPGFYFEFNYLKALVIKLNLEEFVLSVLKEIHDTNRPFKSIKSIYACLSYWQVHRCFGRQKLLDYEASIELAGQLESMYTEALEFGKDLLSTGFQYADDLLILAVHIRYDAYKTRKSSEKNTLELIGTLKHGLTHSPSNYQLKMLLLNLYSHLGAYESLHSMYSSMEIKNIQNYSTANLLLVHNMRLGSIASSILTYTTIGHFYLTSIFDMANFLVNCYKYGTFLKAIEIFQFLNTIRKSLSLNMCLSNFMCVSFIMQSTNLAPTQTGVEQIVSTTTNQQPDDELNEFKTLQATVSNHLKELLNASTAYDQDTGLLPDDLTELNKRLIDHNDKEVMFNWEPSEEESLGKKQYELIIGEQQVLLKLRNLMIRFVNAFLKLNLPPTGEPEDKQVNYSNLIDVYKQKLVNFDYKFDYSLGSPDLENEDRDEELFDSKLKIYVTKSFYLKRWSQLRLNQLINAFVNLSSDLCFDEKFLDKEQAGQQSHLTQYRDNLKEHFDFLKKRIDQELCNFNGEFNIDVVPRLLELFSSSLEAISFVLIIFTLTLSNSRIKAVWTERVKKSKKKKPLYVQYAGAIDLLFEVFELLCQLINYYQLKLKQVVCSNIVALTQKTCQHIKSTVGPADATQGSLNDIGQSYLRSFEELKSIFSAKLKYLLRFSGNSTIQLDNLENSIANLQVN